MVRRSTPSFLSRRRFFCRHATRTVPSSSEESSSASTTSTRYCGFVQNVSVEKRKIYMLGEDGHYRPPMKWREGNVSTFVCLYTYPISWLFGIALRQTLFCSRKLSAEESAQRLGVDLVIRLISEQVKLYPDSSCNLQRWPFSSRIPPGWSPPTESCSSTSRWWPRVPDYRSQPSRSYSWSLRTTSYRVISLIMAYLHCRIAFRYQFGSGFQAQWLHCTM